MDPRRSWAAASIVFNLVLMSASFWLLSATIAGFPKPSVWMAAVQIGLPWLALLLVWLFPHRFVILFSARGEGRLALIGVFFFSCLVPLGTYCYVSPVRRLSLIEAALAAGAALCGAVVATELRSTHNGLSLLILLPLSFGYGYAAVLQLNCAMDRTPVEVRNMVVAYKLSGDRYKPRLGMSPRGTEEPSGENGNRYHAQFAASVPMRVFNAVTEGGPVCVVMRDGALGIRWYTAVSCPWDGRPLPLGIGGSL